MQRSGPWLQKPLHATFAETETNSSISAIRNDLNHSTQNNNDGNSYNTYNNDNNTYSSIQESSFDQNTYVITPSDQSIPRHLTLFDLVSIGVGGTIGSGIFVLCGFIANKYAGPAVSICWVISGLAACLSGVCYAELACRLPAAGSSYVYVYASMGELPAMLVAACLTLEYVVSGAAVARSWGDKMVRWMEDDLGIGLGRGDKEGQDGLFHWSWLVGGRDGDGDGGGFNVLAALVSATSILLLMNGVKESKRVTNFFTMTKVLLVVFMAVMGLVLMKPKENLTPFLPPQFGLGGIFRGATSSFFGYIGFDELACMSHEAINPQRNMPLSIVYTLGIVTLLYVAAALALTGMQPYTDISDVSGFPSAFQSNDMNWAAQIAAFGEVFTLPIVVLISIMAQPRLQYALAKDGLLPPIFARVDENGNLWWGTVIAGIAMVLIASFVPFHHLNDMICAGILIAFAMTDSSLVLMRYDSPDNDEGLVDRLLPWINLTCFLWSVSVTHFWDYLLGKVVALVCTYKLIQSMYRLIYKCTPSETFGGKTRLSKNGLGDMSMSNRDYFKTPLMPYIPCLGIFVNFYLVAQLDLLGIGLLLAYLGVVTLFYFSYGIRHSVGNNGGWGTDDDHSFDSDEGSSLYISNTVLPPLA